MRTISADQDALLTAQGGTFKRMRAQFKDAGGTFRDLSTYAGADMVVSASWSENIDSNGHDCTIVVQRANEKFSLSPFMQASALNRDFVFPGSYAPLIDLNRECKVEWSIAATDSAPAFVIGFHGYVDSFNPAGGDGKLQVTARGQYALALDSFIERERVYAHASPADPDATKGCRPYVNGDTWVVGELALPSEAKFNGHFYAVSAITTGVGGTEGTWPTGAGATVVMGGVTFQEKGVTTTVTGTAVETVMQQLLNDNMSAPPTLNTPASPSWLIRVYRQQRAGVFSAIRALADQIGWDLRYVWNSGLSDYRLELRDVPRAKVTPDRTFAPSEHFKISRMQAKLDGIRNVIRIIFLDSQDLDAGGFPKRKVVEVSDATSISKYGRRFMEVAEGKGSNIDTTGEATTLANAILSDLKDPVAEMEVEMPFFPFVELGDLYRFTADGIHFDVNQDIAVVGYAHDFKGGDKPKATTTLTLRGKPSGGYTRWLLVEAGRGKEEVHSLVTTNSLSTTLSIDNTTVGGAKLKAQQTFAKHALPAGFEFHLSTTPGFTPGTSTLVQKSLGDEYTMTHGYGGQTYYAQTVPWFFNAGKMVRGQPSAEVSFVAGRAAAGHIQGGIAIGDYPLNGGFETRQDAAALPDHWSIYLGALSTNIDVMEDGNGLSGKRYIRLKNGGVRSAVYPMLQEANEASRRGSIYRFHWWRKAGSGASGTYSALIRLLDYQDNEVLILTVSSTIAINKTTHWVREELFVRLKEGDAGARSLQLIISGGGPGANALIDIDEVRCQYVGDAWYEVGDTTYFTENYEAIPAFANSWVNDVGTCAFRKDAFGTVHLKGSMKNGTVGAAAFTLPVGFRPATNKRFCAPTGFGGMAELQVNSAGTVISASGSNSWVSLDGIYFMTTDVANTTV